MLEYKAECLKCYEIYVSDIRWAVCPVCGTELVPYPTPAPALGAAPPTLLPQESYEESPLSYCRYSLSSETLTAATVKVADYASLLANWRGQRVPLIHLDRYSSVPVARYIVDKPLTAAQLRRLPMVLKKLVAT